MLRMGLLKNTHSISLETIRAICSVPIGTQSENSECSLGTEVTSSHLWLCLQLLVQDIIEEGMDDKVLADPIRAKIVELKERMEKRSRTETTDGPRNDLRSLINLLGDRYEAAKIRRSNQITSYVNTIVIVASVVVAVAAVVFVYKYTSK
jgi:hypothetical protein